MEHFKHVTERGGEGLVIKTFRSKYMLGETARYKGEWLKMKPDYLDSGGIVDIDVLVMGAKYGEGRRRGTYGSFLLGVRLGDPMCLPDGSEDLSKVKYQPFAWVGSGLTDTERLEIQRLVEESGVGVTLTRAEWRQRGPPNGKGLDKYEFGINGEVGDWPNVMWGPYSLQEKGYPTITMCVKCANLLVSENFVTGLTMRFPRVQQVRNDKAAQSVVSLAELRTFQASAFDKPLTGSWSESTETMKKKRNNGRRTEVQGAGDVVGFESVPVLDDLFGLWTFYIDPSGTFSSHDQLEEPILSPMMSPGSYDAQRSSVGFLDQ